MSRFLRWLKIDKRKPGGEWIMHGTRTKMSNTFAANEPGGRNRYTQYCMFFKATYCYSFADVKCNNYHGGYICKNVN